MKGCNYWLAGSGTLKMFMAIVLRFPEAIIVGGLVFLRGDRSLRLLSQYETEEVSQLRSSAVNHFRQEKHA